MHVKSGTKWLPFAAMLTVALTACAGGVINPPMIGGSYDARMLDYIASEGDLHTQVVGNPFDAPKEELDGVITTTT